MAIAYDTATRWPSTATTDTTTGSRTFSHAGSANAKGAVVLLLSTGTASVATGVLYGGSAMTLVTSGWDTVEAGRIDVYALTTGVPGGTQTVTIQGATGTAKWVTCATVTAAADTVVDAWTQSGDRTNLSGTSATMSPAEGPGAFGVSGDAVGFAGMHHGNAAPSATALSNTTLVHSMDYGALSSQTIRTTTNVTAGGFVNIGITITSDDWASAGLALIEGTPAATVSPPQPTIIQQAVQRAAVR